MSYILFNCDVVFFARRNCRVRQEAKPEMELSIPMVTVAEDRGQKRVVWGLRWGAGIRHPPCTGPLSLNSGFFTLSSG